MEDNALRPQQAAAQAAQAHRLSQSAAQIPELCNQVRSGTGAIKASQQHGQEVSMPPTPYEFAFSQQGQAIESLEGLVTQLVERLHPVLQPISQGQTQSADGSSASSGPKNAMPKAPVTSALEQHTARINYAVEIMRAYLPYLDI